MTDIKRVVDELRDPPCNHGGVEWDSDVTDAIADFVEAAHKLRAPFVATGMEARHEYDAALAKLAEALDA